MQPNDPARQISEASDLTDRPSSMGQLDRLPSEIISMIISLLDIQAVARLSHVSFQGNLVVRAHPQYRDLKKFVPDVLAVLISLGIPEAHSVGKLHAALRSDRCAACPEFGPFLFLLTAERGCLECLQLAPAFRSAFPEKAKKKFGLSDAHLQQLATLRVPPRRRWQLPIAMAKGCRLVSTRAARELATASGLGPLPPAKLDGDRYYGMASIRFPSVSAAGVVEEGLWCYGCRFLCAEYMIEKESNYRQMLEGLAGGYYAPGSTRRSVLGLESLARPRALFLEHAYECHGTWQLFCFPGWKKRRESRLAEEGQQKA
jgi:hypothetical protein